MRLLLCAEEWRRFASHMTSRTASARSFKPLLENENANLPVSALRSTPRWQTGLILLPPSKQLVGVDANFASDLCDARAAIRRQLNHPALLGHCPKNACTSGGLLLYMVIHDAMVKNTA
jgi:hypothetical protein